MPKCPANLRYHPFLKLTVHRIYGMLSTPKSKKRLTNISLIKFKLTPVIFRGASTKINFSLSNTYRIQGCQRNYVLFMLDLALRYYYWFADLLFFIQPCTPKQQCLSIRATWLGWFQQQVSFCLWPPDFPISMAEWFRVKTLFPRCFRVSLRLV